VPDGVTIVDPVYIEDDVLLDASVIGPNVSIGAGSQIVASRLRNTIIGAGAAVTNSNLSGSMVGDAAVVENASGRLNVSDHSVVSIEE
jgi:glucose-1-phosphate thymidylyltransferase